MKLQFVEEEETEELEEPEPPKPKTRKPDKKILPAKKIEGYSESSFDGDSYKPHGTDIMTAFKLISGKSIRKYKGKGTNKALLEGLLEKGNEMLKKL